MIATLLEQEALGSLSWQRRVDAKIAELHGQGRELYSICFQLLSEDDLKIDNFEKAKELVNAWRCRNHQA